MDVWLLVCWGLLDEIIKVYEWCFLLIFQLLAFIQERGRSGRWNGASPSSDEYILCGSIWSYVHIITRLYIKESSSAPNDDDIGTNINANQSQSFQLSPLDEYYSQYISNLNGVVVGLILPSECIKYIVARLTENPYAAVYSKTVQLLSCGDTCDYCLRLCKSKAASAPFPLVNKAGV